MLNTTLPLFVSASTLASFEYVRDTTVDLGADCPECSDEDAEITLNLYVREWGRTVRFVECCVNCAKRITLEEQPAEVLIEIPESLRPALVGVA